MIQIELTDEELSTVLFALDQAALIDIAGITVSAERCWKKLREVQIESRTSHQFRNSVADAVGEGEQAELPFDGARDVVDPFDLSNYKNMGDK